MAEMLLPFIPKEEIESLVTRLAREISNDYEKELAPGKALHLVVTLKGALWLPNAGRGVHYFDPVQADTADRLAEMTGRDKARPLVFFCVNSQCWLSYNASLRAAALGYSRVYWYRGGIEAWREAGLPLEKLGESGARP